MIITQIPAAGTPTLPAAGTNRPLPAHGTLSRAKQHRCKCVVCQEEFRTYMSTRARLIAYGRWQPYVDAEPVRAHVRMLMGYGIGYPRVRVLSGVSGGGMCRLMYGMGGRGPSKRVRPATADRILAVKPVLESVAPSALVDGTGTRRRLQALVVVGWPQVDLARRAGLDKVTVLDQIHGLYDTTYGSTARTVRDLYDRLWNVDPVGVGVESRWVEQARTLAGAHGWAPPGAWDDDYIDSPAAVPDVGERVDRYDAISEDALWLIDTQGYTREQAANRLGITGRHLERALTYARQEAAA